MLWLWRERRCGDAVFIWLDSLTLLYPTFYNILYIINNKYSLTTQLSAQSRPSKSERAIPTIGEN